MKRLPKEKRNQLIVVVLVTLMALSGLWFGLISFQQKKLQNVRAQRDAATKKLQEWNLAIKNASQVESDLAESSKKLAELENGMASGGDLYSWAYNMLRQFRVPYKVEIPQFSAIDGPKDMTMLPEFPYKQASLTIGGTAFFHDLGRFIADFENQFPYARVLNLNLEPLSGTAEREKLSFKMEIALLVKPNAP